MSDDKAIDAALAEPGGLLMPPRMLLAMVEHLNRRQNSLAFGMARRVAERVILAEGRGWPLPERVLRRLGFVTTRRSSELATLAILEDQATREDANKDSGPSGLNEDQEEVLRSFVTYAENRPVADASSFWRRVEEAAGRVIWTDESGTHNAFEWSLDERIAHVARSMNEEVLAAAPDRHSSGGDPCSKL